MNRKMTFISAALMLTLLSLAFGAQLAGAFGHQGNAKRIRGHSHAAPVVQMSTVPPSTLARIGLTLSAPDSASAVGKGDAESAAYVGEGHREVLESVLAHCSYENAVPKLDRLCWVVSVDPTGEGSSGPINAPKVPFTFDIAIVDASSGDLLFGLQGA
jgi:hypothetical protein